MNRLLQALIALSGLAITGLLTWQGLENDRAQTRLALLALFSEQVGVAMNTCSPTTLVMATDAANELARVEKGGEKYKDYLAQVTSEIEECSRTRGQTQQAQSGRRDGVDQPSSGGAIPPEQQEMAVQTSPAVVSQNVKLRQEEGETAPGAAAPTPNQRWYTVVASYRPGEEQIAAEHVQEVLRQSRTMQPPVRVEVYRTRLSGLYAIVLTGEGATRESARDLVGLARRNGWARDAFVQNDRNWVSCGTGDSAEALRRCGGGRLGLRRS
jgi:hypothetical protein